MLKRLWEWIKYPHGRALVVLYIVTAGCITGAIALSIVGLGKDYDFIAYIFYGAAAVLLGYTVYTIVIFVPVLKKKAVAGLEKHEFTGKLYRQYGFRTIMLAVVALAISLANAIINGTIGLIYLSVWYCALGAYYLLLSVMRGGVLIYHRKKSKSGGAEDGVRLKIREIKTYRTCGVWLVLLPLALSFAILEMVISDRAFVRSGLMIYAAAAYTFYKVVMSLRNFIKARRSDEFTVRAIRNVNLADAMVSVLALQTAMFHEFSPETSLGYANAIMGGIVCALTVALGAAMIINANIKIKQTLEVK